MKLLWPLSYEQIGTWNSSNWISSYDRLNNVCRNWMIRKNVVLLHVRSSRSLNSATLYMKCFSSSSYFHDSFEVLKRYHRIVEEIKGRVRGRLNSVLQALLGSTEKLPDCCLDQSWLCRPSQGTVAKQGHTAYTVVWYTHTTYTVVASNL